MAAEKKRNRVRASLTLAAGLASAAISASANDKVVVAASTKAVSFAPLYLAKDGGALEKRGVDLTITLLAGGTLPMAALLAGNAQFAALADDGLMELASTGKIICVYSYNNSFTQNLQVRNPFLEAHNVSMDVPWQERVRRMRGITMGVLALGGSSDLAGRWLWKEAGLDYTKDMTIVRVGALPALVASLKQGATDGFVLSSPAREIVESQGIGKAVVRFEEVKQWADEPFETIEVLRDYLGTNKDLISRVISAVAAAQKQIYDDPKTSAAILAKASFAGTDEAQLEEALKAMHTAFRQVKMSDARWKTAVAWHKSINPSLGGLELKDGTDWTNEFYPH